MRLNWDGKQAQTIGRGFHEVLPNVVNAIQAFVLGSVSKWGGVMDLDLELGAGGALIKQATEEDILGNLHRGGFVAILLSTTPDTYVKCTRVTPNRWWWRGPRYCLEYQDGAADKHYQAVGQVSQGLVVSTLLKYLRNNSSWMKDFRWEHVDVNASGVEKGV